MRLLIKKITKSGKDEREWVRNVESVIVFDDVKPRLQVDSDLCVRKPVELKNLDKYKERE